MIVLKAHKNILVLLSAAMFSATSVQSTPFVKSTSVATNAQARALTLKDVNGKIHRLLADTKQKATLFFFVLPDCPLANRCAPEINRIASEYRERGILSFLVYVGDDLTPKIARRHAKDYGFTLPALLDPEQQLVRLSGVTVSPEVAVFAPDNTPLYRGRIDDRLTQLGQPRTLPSRRDLREALDAILEGKAVPEAVTKAVGCYLPTQTRAESRTNSP